ncbi:autotransporter domain-containing protein [Bradyrhizobium sp. CCGUVB14]|uniref:autotransporter domain-containing protein n=1 Tax=Bradyrhizobium sp. CCGUVB14 TaxID=2949628 RepID=UPI0020B33A61|nr:autotransporter domain-containing protein [Bradyrhizobium sp. CCGUVB14]MCP3441775.1 autotransporter domain-containing protein [Bradyrhizobium sp. CCGUVB14]
MKRLLLASSALASCLFSVSAQAQSVWHGFGNSTATSDYNLDTNWSNPPAGAPPINAGQSAQFTGGGSTTITVTAGPITPDSWTFGANASNYALSGSDVNFNGAGPNLVNNANTGQSISISNNMTGAGISQAGASTLTLSGTNSFTTTSVSAGTLANSGTLTSAVSVTNSLATYENTGTQNGGLDNNGVTRNSGTLNGGLINSGGYIQFAGSTNGGLTNINSVGAHAGAFNGAIDNSTGGLFEIFGTVTSDSTFTNSTTSSVLFFSSGSYTVAGLITNSGTDPAGGIAVSAGSTLNANGGLTNNANATIVNSGGTVTGNLSNAGIVTNSGAMGAVTNTGSFDNQSGGSITTLTNNSGTFTNESGATVSGAATISGGTVTNAGTFSSTLGLTGGTFTNNAGGQVQGMTTMSFATVNNNGTMAGVTINAGTLNNNNGGTIATVTASDGNFRNYAGATVSGAVSISASNITLNHGTFASTLDATGGIFTNAADGQVLGATTHSGGGMTNYGTMAGVTNSFGSFTNYDTGSITTLTNSGGSFYSLGTVSGAATISGGSVVNHQGTFASTIGLTGGSFENDSGSVVQGATTNNGGAVGNYGTMAGVTNTSGTFGNNTGGSITTLNNNGGTFTNDTGATVSGAATISAGSVTNAGTFSSTLGLTGGTFTNNTGGQVQGATTNNGGTVNNNGTMAGAINTSGTFNNNNNATITTLINNGGLFQNDNQGRVTGAATVSSGTVQNAGTFASTLGLTGGTFNNFGTVQGATTNNGGTVGNGGTMAGVTNTSGTFNNNGTGSITTLNNNGGTFNNDATISGAATISGGTVFVTGTGTIGGAVSLTNAAGTLDISGVTTGLSITDFSGVSGSTVNLGAKTLTIAGGTQTFGGAMQGAGNLVLSSGAETLTGTSSYSGTTTVNGGTLRVDGSIASSSMTTVNATSTLSGVGTVGNVSVNGGLFAPGQGVVGGSMTVAGSLVLSAASTYLVEVTPATSTSSIVTGNANLGGATLGVNFAAGSYVSKQYTVVAASSITGAFNPTILSLGLPAGFSISASNDGTHAYLNLVLNFAPPSGNLNVNQQNVGNAIINFFNTTGGISMAFGGLTPAGLTQLSGEVGSAPQQSTFNVMTQFMGVMTDPFVAGRGDPVSAGGAPNAYADESMAYAATAKGRSASARDAFAAYTKAPIAPSFEQRWSVWAAGFGGAQQTDGNNALGSNNTTSSLYATAVGADYRVSRDTLLGFALAGGGTNFTVANNLGGGRSDLFQAGAFFRHNAGPAYITGALAYGWQDITTDRTVTVAGVDRLRAEFNANAWSGRLEGGYRFVSQGIGLTPYAAAQVTAFDLPAYAEQAIAGSNQFALAYGAKSVTDTRSELGLRTDKAFGQDDGIVTLRGRVAWAHDYNPNRAIGATFQTLPGASFVVNGAAMASETALVTAAAEKKWLNGWSAAATFEGEFSNVTRSYAGKGVVRYAW